MLQRRLRSCNHQLRMLTLERDANGHELKQETARVAFLFEQTMRMAEQATAHEQLAELATASNEQLAEAVNSLNEQLGVADARIAGTEARALAAEAREARALAARSAAEALAAETALALASAPGGAFAFQPPPQHEDKDSKQELGDFASVGPNLFGCQYSTLSPPLPHSGANTPVPDLPSLFTAPAPVRPFSLPSFSLYAPTCLYCQTNKMPWRPYMP